MAIDTTEAVEKTPASTGSTPASPEMRPAAGQSPAKPRAAVTSSAESARTKHRYLLLMRHGPRDRSSAVLESRQVLTDAGARQVAEVAAALREIASGVGGVDVVRVGRVLHGTHAVAKQTAGALARQCGPRPEPDPLDKLDPAWFYGPDRRSSGPESHGELVDGLRGELAKLGDGNNAILVVGHQPQLGWIAETLTGEAEAISHGEVLCIRLDQAGKDGKSHLLWALTPAEVNEKVLPELKAKIESKMKVAELLGAVIVGVLSWLLTSMFDDKVSKPLGESTLAALAFGLSLAAFAVALALYLMTVFAYDELQMPALFWSQGRAKRGGIGRVLRWAGGAREVALCRPPSSSARMLYRYMVNAWSRLFVPATWAVGVGLALLALSGVAVQASRKHPPSLFGWVVAPTLAVLAALLCARRWERGRPRLGTQD